MDSHESTEIRKQASLELRIYGAKEPRRSPKGGSLLLRNGLTEFTNLGIFGEARRAEWG